MSGHDDRPPGADRPGEHLEVVFEGRHFPDEAGWLDLVLPADAPAIVRRAVASERFVERTLAALRDPTPEHLAAFEPPEPSADFVARTVGAIHQDRRARWREILARYVAPEPSQQFVERTLQALAGDRDPGGGPAAGDRPRGGFGATAPMRLSIALRTWALPLLAVAAVLIVAFLLPQPKVPPTGLRSRHEVPVAFGPSWSASPLPGILVTMDLEEDARALPRSGPDGILLLLAEEPR